MYANLEERGACLSTISALQRYTLVIMARGSEVKISEWK